MYPAIPTKYNGIQFRSRLEAKWARFFELCGWNYEYEPLDLPGYIPDFFLKFQEPLLVEVKPAMTIDELGEHREKIKASGWDKPSLLLGATWFPSTWEDNFGIGLISQRWPLGENERDVWGWTQCDLTRCQKCGQIGIFCPDGSWFDYRCGGDGEIAGPVPEAIDLWKEAGNRVQWMAK